MFRRMTLLRNISAVMMWGTAFCFGFLAQTGLSQSAPRQTLSPTDVVALFRKIDSSGQRLTRKGWDKAASLFQQPEPQSTSTPIIVMTWENVGQAVVKGDRAEVWYECYVLGHIDASGRFTRQSGAAVPFPMTVRGKYTLVRSTLSPIPADGHSKAGQTLGGWKIEIFQPYSRTTVAVALDYLRSLRARSTDPIVRQNAEESIRTVRRMNSEAKRGTDVP